MFAHKSREPSAGTAKTSVLTAILSGSLTLLFNKLFILEQF